MIKLLQTLFIVLTVCTVAMAQPYGYNVNFEDDTKGGYSSGDVTLNGIIWNLTDALILQGDSGDVKFDAKCGRIRNTGTMTMLADYPDGAERIYVYYANFGKDTIPMNWKLSISTDQGANWTDLGTVTAHNKTAKKAVFDNLGYTGNVRLKIEKLTGGSKRLCFDNLMLMGPGEIPTPLNFLSFTALNRGNQVALGWQTAAERNVSHFAVERSDNGRAFRTIGRVDASGIDARSNRYSYTDRDPLNGVNYYRITGIDNDGTTTISSVVPVRVDKGRIELHATAQGEVTISAVEVVNTLRVYDTQGQIVYTGTIAPQGTLQLPEELQNGLYVMTLQSGQDIITEKLMLQR